MLEKAMGQLRLIHPAAEDQPVMHQLAARLDSLEGKRIGLIDNRKRHSDVFLARLQELFVEKYKVAGFEYYTKIGASVATPPEIMDDLISKCDAVIHAVAD
ncbi:MAG: hypothetical protein CMM59_09180 [Rhodospirillaceae bacterium]|nr:hypothetical protein [Rhodospirillaceae bacterium]|tara:strand:+ start:827 stop:1129 length:303 start_codon:yes stop_codon:yes gene_type:complete